MTTDTAPNRPPGRPASFRREDVIALARDLFRARGYADVSLSEIAQKSGLTRASVYNAFTSKEAIFLEALDAYRATAPLSALADLAPDAPVGPALDALFRDAGATMARDPDRRGCLLMNSFAELLASDAPPAETIRADFAASRAMLATLVARARDKGELPSATDPDTTATLIMMMLAGLNTLSKSGATEAEMARAARLLLTRIGFAPPSPDA